MTYPNKFWRWPTLVAPLVTAVIVTVMVTQSPDQTPSNPAVTPSQAPAVQRAGWTSPLPHTVEQLGVQASPTRFEQPIGYIRAPSVKLSPEMDESLSDFRQWAVEMASQYPGELVLQGRGLRVALTFDDGPNAATADILTALRDTPCTFFMVGGNGDAWAQRMQQVLAAGHEIAMHSYNHPRFADLSPADIQQEIMDNRTALAEITGDAPILLRPPYGHIPEDQISWCTQQGITLVDWSVDSLDWHLQDQQQIIDNVLESIHPGAIVLMHSQPRTAQLLPELMSKIREAGYELVTVSGLLP